MTTVYRASLRNRSQLTLPQEVRTRLKVEDGDELEFEINEDDGTVVVRGMRLIPTDQAWFWTDSWQRGEYEASQDIKTGRVETFDDPDIFLKSLD